MGAAPEHCPLPASVQMNQGSLFLLNATLLVSRESVSQAFESRFFAAGGLVGKGPSGAVRAHPPNLLPLHGGAPGGLCAPRPHPGPGSARRNSENARVGGRGRRAACVPTPARALQVPRAEGWGSGMGGRSLAHTRVVAAVGEMEPGRRDGASWDLTAVPPQSCWLGACVGI